MARNDAVKAITGEIFEDGWSRVRGSMQGLGERRKQMVRAARGNHSAVFKAIRSGGTHTKKQLRAQLEYLTSKSSHIVDSRGVYDGKQQLNSDEIGKVVQRFSSRWDEGFNPKMGHTTHMLMSFPIGTKGTDVRDIASSVAERFFANEERHFDYLIAVHEDRAHPHAHIVLNRKSQEGEYFFLGRDHHFNYDDFRLAMVEEAEKYGVRLEATRRLDRGLATYAPRTKEVYAAKEEGREPVARERIGRDLDRALAEIATASKIYSSLSVEASDMNREDIANALFRAGEILAQHGQLVPDGEVYMAENHSFDELRDRFAERTVRIQNFITDAPAATRAMAERKLNEVQATIGHMQPLGVRSATLQQNPSEGGVYSEMNINKELVERARSPETRAEIETALRGTGISSSTVVARLETGAQNAALEQRWLADDLAKIADTQGLNLERREDLEKATDALDQVHVRLGQTLERAEVLRTDGVIEEDRDITFHYDEKFVETQAREIRQSLRGDGLSEAEIADRAVEIEDSVNDLIEREQGDYLAGHPDILQSPNLVYQGDGAGGGQIDDQALADRLDREVEAIMARAEGSPDLATAVAKDFKERYPDMPDHLANGLGETYANSYELNNRDAVTEAVREAALDRDALEASMADSQRDMGIERAEREGIDAQTAVLTQADRQAFTALEQQLQNTDFNWPYADDSATRQSGQEEVALATQKFNEFAAQSPAHASLASGAWDRATDLINPPREQYVPEAQRIDVKWEATDQSEIRRVIEHEREDKIHSPFETNQQASNYRDEIESDLSDDQLEALRGGDADALSDVIDGRLERLYAAKAYLQSDPEAVPSEALKEVVDEIADEEFEAQRLKHVQGHSEKGTTHG